MTAYLGLVQTRAHDVRMIPQVSCHASVIIRLTSSGAIYASDSSLFIDTGTVFILNVASTGSGGGVYVSSSVMALSGTVFRENRANTEGGWSSPVL